MVSEQIHRHNSTALQTPASEPERLRKHILRLEVYPAPRHERQTPAPHHYLASTGFGDLTVINRLYELVWYMGHKPGENIFRLYELKEVAMDKLAMARGLFRSSGLIFCYEGTVPFSAEEYRDRFEGTVFPDFMTMVIALLCFDPEHARSLASYLQESHNILTQDKQPDLSMADSNSPEIPDEYLEDAIEMAERDDEKKFSSMIPHIKALRKLWLMKYGDDHRGLPAILQTQLRAAESRITEMAWLIQKSEAGSHAVSPSAREFWAECLGLLRTIAGESVETLAARYVRNVLRDEAMKQLLDGSTHDNILFFSNNSCRVSVLFFRSHLTIYHSLPKYHGESLCEGRQRWRAQVSQMRYLGT